MNASKPKYYAKEFARGRWHVIAPNGVEVYDNAPYGKDKPLIFHDEDAVMAFVERCNADCEPESV